MTELARTPLYEQHRRLGARLIPFGGYEMPVQYTSILEEHRAVREAVGVFDVSHMGQIHFRGPGAVEAVERLVTCRVSSLRHGRVRYGCLCNEDGGVIDDVTVYRVREEELFLCVNAANVEKDRDWVRSQTRAEVSVEDRSRETGLLALQGPRSVDLLDAIVDPGVRELGRFAFREGRVASRSALISRTGYTGADGFELYASDKDTVAIFEALLEQGKAVGLRPAGLGARDTLRIEAALPLYGHELDETTSPLEARLDRFVKLDTGGFIGAEAIERRRQAGHERLLVGFELLERGVARAGHELLHGGEVVGEVTSGAPSPTLGKSIGLGYVPPALAGLGGRLEVGIRQRRVPARIVETPFVKRGVTRRKD